MCRDSNTEKGYQIAGNLRKTLFRIDLAITYAEGERKLAHERYKLDSKIGTKKAKKAAERAKMRERCYGVYLKNVEGIKNDVMGGIEYVLSRYAPKYRGVWVMYFLEQRSIDEICGKLDYSRRSVDRIVKTLKDDLCETYGAWKDIK